MTYRPPCKHDRLFRPLLWAILVVPTIWTVPVFGQALTSESLEVRSLLDSAKSHLASRPTEIQLGGQALVGLVFVKDGDSSHPRVTEAEKASLEFAARSMSDLVAQATIYELCMCTLFLCEQDAPRHRAPIEKMLQALFKRQQSGGGFGYSANEEGDTSMTQYAVLTLWTAHHHDMEIDWTGTNRVLEWLLRAQTPAGAWGYQIKDPGKLGQRNEQEGVRLSLVAGGLGSVFICADLLGAGDKLKGASDAESKLPAAFKPIEIEGDKKKRKGALSPTLLSHVRRSMNDGNSYFAEHFVIPYKKYDHYYLYALERYESFRKQMEKTPGNVPDWYEKGVVWLKATQGDDGGWTGDCQGGADTAFACLFLMRSTEKSIQASLGQGLLTGGRGLPKDLSNVRVRGGKIVSQPLTASPDEIFAILEDPDSPDFAALADNPESVMLSGDAGKREGELQRLRRLVQSGDVAARRLAVQALGRHRDFENVPVLIYALGDDDHQVVRAARDALKFISRRFDGFGMPDFPNEEQQRKGIDDWKGWYRSVRPGAKFLE